MDGRGCPRGVRCHGRDAGPCPVPVAVRAEGHGRPQVLRRVRFVQRPGIVLCGAGELDHGRRGLHEPCLLRVVQPLRRLDGHEARRERGSGPQEQDDHGRGCRSCPCRAGSPEHRSRHPRDQSVGLAGKDRRHGSDGSRLSGSQPGGRGQPCGGHGHFRADSGSRADPEQPEVGHWLAEGQRVRQDGPDAERREDRGQQEQVDHCRVPDVLRGLVEHQEHGSCREDDRRAGP